MIGHLLAVRKGEDVMSTMTAKKWGGMLCSLVAACALLGSVSEAHAAATVASDASGAIIIFPKIIVDTSGRLGPRRDTQIELTNTSNSVIAARCYWVEATSHCSNAPSTPCTLERETNSDTRVCPTGGTCVAQWNEHDFRFTLTKRQPIAFSAGAGLPDFPLSESRGLGGQTNNNSDGSPSAIPPVVDDPFFGELKCVEVDPTDFLPSIGFNPGNNGAGDLAGHATIVTVNDSKVDARKYNGIVLQSTTINDRNDTLQIGGPNAEYAGCPNILILDHFFDNALVGSHKVAGSFNVQDQVATDLTVIPCSEDFRLQENNLGGAVLQFLVFNEFEQRFSASTSFTCFKEIQLSDIDTRIGPNDNTKSIFNVNVQGTLSGQTRIRSVINGDEANGVLGIAERFFDCSSGPSDTCSSAEDLHWTGTRTQGDQIILSPDLP
ncbi:MAG: hypothetical protein HY270_24345 [Deltaproteobacteria bacterium]|nr:hypothetical protein [Deltaproteobacteria bacterium]